MNTKASRDGGARKASDNYRNRRRRPEPNSEFAALVVRTREQVGMSQGELAKAAGVSPRTVVQVEEEGSARADVIIRVAAAMGQPVEEWLVKAGHKVSPERVRDVLRQREREKEILPFARLDPVFLYTRMLGRIEKKKPALMCNFVTSQVPIDRPDLVEIFGKMFKENLHLALICPFPIADRNISFRRSRLNEYYGSAYKWTCLLAKQLREKFKDHRQQISVFAPAFKDSTILVAPPIRVSEHRPAFIKYGSGPDLESEFELGAYLRFLDGRPDQWIEIYGGGKVGDARVEEAFGAWHDYCADILESWTPENEKSSFDDNKLVFWQRTIDDGH